MTAFRAWAHRMLIGLLIIILLYSTMGLFTVGMVPARTESESVPLAILGLAYFLAIVICLATLAICTKPAWPIVRAESPAPVAKTGPEVEFGRRAKPTQADPRYEVPGKQLAR